MPMSKEQIAENAPTIHLILDQIASKWAIMVITNLCDKPQRFNALKHQLDVEAAQKNSNPCETSEARKSSDAKRPFSS